MRKKIGIIGYGNMGSAIAERIKSKYQIWVFDKDKNKTKNLKGINVADNIIDLANKVDTVILAVKPQDFDILLNEIRDFVKGKLIISIAAGISTGYIEKYLGKARVIRTMPNMPARIGRGLTCLCKGEYATQRDLTFTIKIFSYLGVTFILDESMINAATAISGSGPGFWCDFIEDKPKSKWKDFSYNVFVPDFVAAARGIGFSKKEAELLVKTTTSGSLATVGAWDITPFQLKKQITSKGGTTEAGLKVLHQGGSLKEAVKAALRRAKELSRRQ